MKVYRLVVDIEADEVNTKKSILEYLEDYVNRGDGVFMDTDNCTIKLVKRCTEEEYYKE